MQLELINIEWNLFHTVPLGTARQRISSGPFVMVVNIILKIIVIDDHNVTPLLEHVNGDFIRND